MLGFLFPLSLFLSAFLLFSIQPMVAKALLPAYGGAPGVWLVCMLFFQVMLLGAYAYVGLLSRGRSVVRVRYLHAGLMILSLLLLPLALQPLLRHEFGAPEWGIFYSLLQHFGIPLFLLAASAPLLQCLYSYTAQPDAADPYFLYGASNCGSMLALLIYPFGIERFIGLNTQFRWWIFLFVAELLLLAALLFFVRFRDTQAPRTRQEPLTLRQVTAWLVLSFIPCSLMLGLTLTMTTDLAPTPLFWVIPLTLYLGSFVLTFTTRSFVSLAWLQRVGLYWVLLTLIALFLGLSQLHVFMAIVLNVLTFSLLALLCHKQLFQRRPAPQHLSTFYFFLALGGVLAGLFHGVIAPHCFNRIDEYPLILALSLFLFPNRVYRYGSVLVVLLCAIYTGTQKTDIIAQARNFYGVKEVWHKAPLHVLISQSTIHGLQNMTEKKPFSGRSGYYGPPATVIEYLQKNNPEMNVTLVGLGIGTLLCQFRAQDKVLAIEVDEQMIALANNKHLFTYLQDCAPQWRVENNDGRLAMAHLPAHSQDLIILDAFNADAIPIHLMTLEAFQLYLTKLSAQGGILVNLSNRHMELLPVIQALGRSLQLGVLYVAQKGDPKQGTFDSEWAFLSVDDAAIFAVHRASSWRFLAGGKQYLWTDDYSNIVPLLV